MSNRVEFPLESASDRAAAFIVTEVVVVIALVLLALEYPFVLQPEIVVPALVAPFLFLVGARVRFDTKHLEIHGLFRRRRIPYREVTSLTLDDDGVDLRLRSGELVRLPVRVRGARRRHVRDSIGYMLSFHTRVRPTSGAIDRIGDSVAPPITRPERSDALVESLGVAARIARGRGSAEIAVRDLVSAVVAGEDGKLLRRAGLPELPELPVEAGPAYRHIGAPAESDELASLIADAMIAVGRLDRTSIEPIDVLVELFKKDDAHVAQLVASGVTQVRLLDAIAHELGPAESDARLYGTLTDAELFGGASLPRAAIVFVNDNYTEVDFVVHVLERQLSLTDTHATALAQQVHREGRARVIVMETTEAARVARRLMSMARLRGFPLRVVLEPE